MRQPGYFLFTILVNLLVLCSAAPFAELLDDSTSGTKLRRATKDLVAPSGYQISWKTAGKRASFNADANGIGYTFIAKSGGVTQALIFQCGAICTKSNQCSFFQLAQISGGKKGTVVCELHSAYVDSISATYMTGPDSTGGTVVTTYGIRKYSTPVSNGGTTTTTTTSTTTTTASSTTSSSTAAASTTSTFPASPPGATLTQFKPACAPSYSVPMFVNNQFARSSLSTAYIVQHGSNRNFDDYFTAVYKVIGNSGIIAAPNFYVSNDTTAPTTWYQPNVNLAWSPDSGEWSVGADAVAPEANACSPFDIYDALLTYFNNNKKLYPNLKNIVFVSHSWGGNLVSRYSQFYDGNFPFRFRYIIANAANQAYFTDARPNADPCSDGLAYPFQLVSDGMPRYISAKFSTTNANAILQRWIGRDVITLVGNFDTADRWPGGTQTCSSQAQGGANRRERNYAWWAYQNILAGTNVDVSKYYGYQQLIAAGAKTLFKGPLNHQNCVIPGVGHYQLPMFNSECGRAAMNMSKSKIPAGVGATYP